MTACTDDERREVARMLRELPGDSTYPDLIGVIADHDGWYPAADAADRLADLIDPGKSGHESGQNSDSVPKESPAVQIAPECDRDALLALADELSGDTFVVPAAYGTYVGGYVAACQDVARRIREALGVTDG